VKKGGGGYGVGEKKEENEKEKKAWDTMYLEIVWSSGVGKCGLYMPPPFELLKRLRRKSSSP
jgi:hypothetical protein